jgi:hypothetical protein
MLDSQLGVRHIIPCHEKTFFYPPLFTSLLLGSFKRKLEFPHYDVSFAHLFLRLRNTEFSEVRVGPSNIITPGSILSMVWLMIR